MTKRPTVARARSPITVEMIDQLRGMKGKGLLVADSQGNPAIRESVAGEGETVIVAVDHTQLRGWGSYSDPQLAHVLTLRWSDLTAQACG